MAVTTPHFNTETEYNAYRLLAKDIADHIISEDTEYKSKKERMFDIKNDIKQERTKAENSNLSRVRENQISNK